MVGTGGFLGSVARYGLSGLVQSLSRSVSFPYGTLAVNLTGCLAVGFLSQLAEARGAFSGETRIFLIAGFLGGFTTFSAFANETMNMTREGRPAIAFGNVALSVGLGLACVWLGRATAFRLWR